MKFLKLIPAFIMAFCAFILVGCKDDDPSKELEQAILNTFDVDFFECRGIIKMGDYYYDSDHVNYDSYPRDDYYYRLDMPYAIDCGDAVFLTGAYGEYSVASYCTKVGFFCNRLLYSERDVIYRLLNNDNYKELLDEYEISIKNGKLDLGKYISYDKNKYKDIVFNGAYYHQMHTIKDANDNKAVDERYSLEAIREGAKAYMKLVNGLDALANTTNFTAEVVGDYEFVISKSIINFDNDKIKCDETILDYDTNEVKSKAVKYITTRDGKDIHEINENGDVVGIESIYDLSIKELKNRLLYDANFVMPGYHKKVQAFGNGRIVNESQYTYDNLSYNEETKEIIIFRHASGKYDENKRYVKFDDEGRIIEYRLDGYHGIIEAKITYDNPTVTTPEIDYASYDKKVALYKKILTNNPNTAFETSEGEGYFGFYNDSILTGGRSAYKIYDDYVAKSYDGEIDIDSRCKLMNFCINDKDTSIVDGNLVYDDGYSKYEFVLDGDKLSKIIYTRYYGDTVDYSGEYLPKPIEESKIYAKYLYYTENSLNSNKTEESEVEYSKVPNDLIKELINSKCYTLESSRMKIQRNNDILIITYVSLQSGTKYENSYFIKDNLLYMSQKGYFEKGEKYLYCGVMSCVFDTRLVPRVLKVSEDSDFEKQDDNKYVSGSWSVVVEGDKITSINAYRDEYKVSYECDDISVEKNIPAEELENV